MYQKLLLSAGGGIISRNQQSEQKDCATVAIGLGGTGISCLRALKKEVYSRVKPDDEQAIVPQYQHIRFLAVDTDKNVLGESDSIDGLDRTEFFDISCTNIKELLYQAHILRQTPSLQ